MRESEQLQPEPGLAKLFKEPQQRGPRMNRLFECVDAGFCEVPDGTLVNPFLNPTDPTSGLPWWTLDNISIAAGCIGAGIVSEIHVHPYITQITVLISGSLDIHMKDPDSMDGRYTLRLVRPTSTQKAGFGIAATVASPGTFFQLDNSRGTEAAHVLYVTSPSYVFEPGEADAPPAYDDAVTVGRDWQRLAEQKWSPPELSRAATSYASRQSALQRLARRGSSNSATG